MEGSESGTTVVPKDAATIMLVRDGVADADCGSNRLEVCMLRRHLDSDFVGGAYVFPGGKVDESDRGEAAEAVCSGRTDTEASALLDMVSGGLAFWIAAIRECFEEAGVLLAYDASARRTELVDATKESVRSRLARLRRRLNAGDVGFLEACRDERLLLAVDLVHYFSHWITPVPAPKRYDTRFFVAALPPGQTPIHDDYETVDTVWVQPADGLDRARKGEFDLIFPTMKNLQAIGRFETSAELLSAARVVERVPTILPRVVSDERGFRILLPGDPGYDEAIAAGSDEASTATASGGDTDLSAEEVSALVRRIDIEGRSRND